MSKYSGSGAVRKVWMSRLGRDVGRVAGTSSGTRARVIGALLTAVLAAGCAVPGPAAPAMDLPGPVLVAEVVNRTDRELTFSYEFAAIDDSSAGSGEGLVPACAASTEHWGQITGDYTLIIDGEPIAEDRLAPGQGTGAFLVVRVQVAPDGEVAVLDPVILAVAPPVGSRQLGAC